MPLTSALPQPAGPDAPFAGASIRPIHTATGRGRQALTPEACARVRAEVEALDGIRRAVVEADPLSVLLVCEAAGGVPAELTARAVLAQHGLGGSEVDVQVCYAPSPQPRRRVRFVDARLDATRVGRARATVELEWDGVVYAESMEGENGPALELRLVALATLRALETVMRGSVAFHLVGIKMVRAFDEEMAVGMVRADGFGDSLVGASLAAGTPYRAAALSVLNATNRFLGNYLANLHE